MRARARSDDTKPIRILAVDDHALLRAGVASLIADEPDMTLVAKEANGRAVSEDAVKGQVRSILSKLGASDRPQAAMIGLKRRIIEP